MSKTISNILYKLIFKAMDVGGIMSSASYYVMKLRNNSWHNCKVLPYFWMDEATVANQLLLPGCDSISYGPNFIDTGNAILQNISQPAVYCRWLANVTVSAHSSSIVLGGKTLIIERCGRDACRSYSYQVRRIVWHGKKNALLKWSYTTRKIKQGIFLGGNGAFNYYHWLIEILVKCMFLNDIPGEYSAFPLLVSNDAREIPQFSEMLKIIAKDREIIWLSKDDIYDVAELVYIDAPNNLPFNVVGTYRFSAGDFFIRRESIDYLRSVYLTPSHSLDASWSSCPKNIFLCRGNDRRGYNQNEVKLLLEGMDFVSLDMCELSFMQQVEIFNNADWIVGPTGAAWTNLVFAKKGLKCLCWMAEGYGEFSAFSNLAVCAGADLRYLTVDAKAPLTSSLYEASYVLDIEKLKSALTSMWAP